MISKEDMEELREDCKAEALREEYYEKKMYNDYDYALEMMDLSMDTSILELSNATKRLNHYGHDITIFELMEDIR